jgi:DNA-binding MarR family transcriptional regulator
MTTTEVRPWVVKMPLSPLAVAVLKLLHEHGQLQRNELAGMTGCTSGGVKARLTELQAAGVVARSRELGSNFNRSSYELTPEGVALVERSCRPT